MLRSYGSAADYAAPAIAHSHRNELNERINRWLTGVQQASGTSSSTATSSVKNRRRVSTKPYTRPEPHLRRRISTSSDTFVDPVEQNLRTVPEVPNIAMQEAEREATERRIVSPVTFRGLDELPDPYHNPLITKYPGDLEEEYNRIVFTYNQFEDMKHQAELRWLDHTSISGMQDLMDIGAAVQRVISSAQYIVDYTYSCGLEIDFQKLFSRNRYPPYRRRTLDLSQHDPYIRNSGVYPV